VQLCNDVVSVMKVIQRRSAGDERRPCSRASAFSVHGGTNAKVSAVIKGRVS